MALVYRLDHRTTDERRAGDHHRAASRSRSALGLRARRGHDMDLEGWSVGGRGFGTIFIFLLMAGEIYSTFTFLGGAGFVYGSGGAAYYILGYGTLAYVLSYYLLPAVWRYATPRKLVSQADVFTSAFGSRALGVVVSVVAVAAMIPYLALQLKGLGIIVSRDLLRLDLLDRGDLDGRGRAVGLRRRLGHPRLGLDGGDQGRPDADASSSSSGSTCRSTTSAGSARCSGRSTRPSPGFAAALRRSAHAGVVLLDRAADRARLLHVAAHVRLGALGQGRARLQAQRRVHAALPAADRVRVLRRLRGRAEGARTWPTTGPTSRCSPWPRTRSRSGSSG